MTNSFSLLTANAGSTAATSTSSGVLGLAVGLVLCFFGVRSLRLTGFLVGFALAAGLAAVLGADPLIVLIVGIAGGIAGFVLFILAFRFGLWLIGGLVGAVIGVRVYQHFFLGHGNALVLVLFLFAVGLICGFLTDHYRQRVLAILTAAAGASAILNGLGQVWPPVLGFLQQPTTPGQSFVATGVWVVLTVAGWLVQRSWLKTKSAR
jgi:hypothetical protein